MTKSAVLVPGRTVATQNRASGPPVFRPDTVQAMADRRVSPPAVYRPNAPAAQLRPAPAWPLQAARSVPLTPSETMRRAMARHTNAAGTIQRTTAKLVRPAAGPVPVSVVQPRPIYPRFGPPFHTETRTVDQLHDTFVSIVRNDYDAARQIDQAIDKHETLECQLRPAASLSSRRGTTTTSAPAAFSVSAAEQLTVIAAARALLAEKSLGISANGSRSGAFASGVASYVPLDTVRRSAMGYSRLFRDRPRDSIDDFFEMIPDLCLIDILNPAAARRKVERAIADTEVRVRTAVENARPVPMAINAATTTVKRGTKVAAKGIRAAKKASEAAEAYRRERDAIFAQVDDLIRETQDYLGLAATQAAGATAAGIVATRAAKAVVRWHMHRTGTASATGNGAGGSGTWGSSGASGWTGWPGTGPASATATASTSSSSSSSGTAWHPPRYQARGPSGAGIGGTGSFGTGAPSLSQMAEWARARTAPVVYKWALPKPFPTTLTQVAARTGSMAAKTVVVAGGLLVGATYAVRAQMAPRFASLNEKLRQLREPDKD